MTRKELVDRLERIKDGIWELSEKGSSWIMDNLGITSIAFLDEKYSSVWSVPRCFATFFAWCASLYWSSSKPIENVLIGTVDCDCINDTIIDESIPPDKKAPIGTSDIILCLTDNFKFASRSLWISDWLNVNKLLLP